MTSEAALESCFACCAGKGGRLEPCFACYADAGASPESCFACRAVLDAGPESRFACWAETEAALESRCAGPAALLVLEAPQDLRLMAGLVWAVERGMGLEPELAGRDREVHTLA